MRNRIRFARRAPAAIVLLLALAFLAWYGPLRTGEPPDPEVEARAQKPVSDTPVAGRIVGVVDGDTVNERTYGAVRMLGIDTPEQDQPLHEEARAALARMLEGKQVELLFDRETKDRYGRTLAHLLVPDGDGKKLAGEELLRAGLASVLIIPPNLLFAERLKAAQKEAVMQRRGLWALPVVDPEKHYVVGAYKFHRPSCTYAAQIRSPRIMTDRRAILTEGKSPCRACKP